MSARVRGSKTEEWIKKEGAGTALPDQRLKTRLTKILRALSKEPERSIPAGCAGWTETLGCYRFLDNPPVSCDGILSGHREATLDRVRQESVVVVVQDTTTITFSRTVAVGLGGTAREKVNNPCQLQVSVACSPAGVNLGVGKGTFWHRAGRLRVQERRRPERRPIPHGRLRLMKSVTAAIWPAVF